MAPFQHRSQSAEHIVVEVETSPGSSDFRVDERLRADEIVTGSDDAQAVARVSVRLDNEFGVVEARRRYHPDLRLLARTDHADPNRRLILFDGFLSRQEARWDGRDGRGEGFTFTFETEHVFRRLAELRDAQIFGRRVRNGRIADGMLTDPDLWRDKSAHVSALPCVFNLDGRPNCAPTPLTIMLSSGQTRTVHLFTSDTDSTAIPWTFVRALRYLAWFHLPFDGPVHEGNLFDATDAYTSLDPEGRTGLSDSDPLGRALLREPESLTCEAVNLVEALAHVADAAGLHFTPETINDAGRPRTQLRLWSPQSGPIRWLYLAQGGVMETGLPRYDAAIRRVDQIVADNNTYRARIAWEHGGIVNAPLVIGDVKRHEMTVELVPGWQPETHLDNVAVGDRSAAKALALTPDKVEALGDDAAIDDWFRTYHRRGSNFRFRSHVARRWVLNEDGRYDAVSYNRNAPFDDYRPFDFSTASNAHVTGPGVWMRRARRFEPTITRNAQGHALGVWVEISFDAGISWHLPSGGVRVLNDQCGIVFETENPTEIVPPGVDPREQNLWFALIDQTLRVRVTAVIEGDDRLIFAGASDASASPTVQVRTRLAYRPDAFAFISRDHTTNVLADVNTGAPDINRDDTPAAAALAAEMAETLQGRRIQATPALPWIDSAYAIGDRLAGVRGQGIRFATTTATEAQVPAIVGKRYRLSNGRYETELVLERTTLRV